jgi:hypothetical protein
MEETKKNIMIKTQVMPRLKKIEGDQSFHDNVLPSFGENFDGYEIEKLKLENTVFHRLDFVTKFCELNKRSFKELQFSNVKILRDVFTSDEESFVGSNLKLRVITLENTNISKIHLIKLIKECQSNDQLTELSLINLEGVNDVMSYFDDSFSRHKSLTTLRLKNCKISDFTSLIPLLTQN